MFLRMTPYPLLGPLSLLGSPVPQPVHQLKQKQRRGPLKDEKYSWEGRARGGVIAASLAPLV